VPRPAIVELRDCDEIYVDPRPSRVDVNQGVSISDRLVTVECRDKLDTYVCPKCVTVLMILLIMVLFTPSVVDVNCEREIYPPVAKPTNVDCRDRLDTYK
jgi:hypothetical protein